MPSTMLAAFLQSLQTVLGKGGLTDAQRLAEVQRLYDQFETQLRGLPADVRDGFIREKVAEYDASKPETVTDLDAALEGMFRGLAAELRL